MGRARWRLQNKRRLRLWQVLGIRGQSEKLVGKVSKNGHPWHIIRPLSVCHTTVLLPPQRRDAMRGWSSGCHASGRTKVCFESNHGLFRVEPRSISSRTTLWEACAACTSAMVPWHEAHRAGLPEDLIAIERTSHSPSIPSPGRHAFGCSAERRVRSIWCCRYGLPERLVLQATAPTGFPV